MDVLRVTVNRTNGHLKIAHRCPLKQFWSMVDAVITPFGIVEGVHSRGLWRWYCKVAWSGPSLPEA